MSRINKQKSKAQRSRSLLIQMLWHEKNVKLNKIGHLNEHGRSDKSAESLDRKSLFDHLHKNNESNLTLDELKERAIADIELINSKLKADLNSEETEEHKKDIKEKYTVALLEISKYIEEVQKSIG